MDVVERYRRRRDRRLKMRLDADDDGIWRTTDNGHKIHINAEGEVDKGNPRVLAKTGNKSKYSPKQIQKAIQKSKQSSSDQFAHKGKLSPEQEAALSKAASESKFNNKIKLTPEQQKKAQQAYQQIYQKSGNDKQGKTFKPSDFTWTTTGGKKIDPNSIIKPNDEMVLVQGIDPKTGEMVYKPKDAKKEKNPLKIKKERREELIRGGSFEKGDKGNVAAKAMRSKDRSIGHGVKLTKEQIEQADKRYREQQKQEAQKARQGAENLGYKTITSITGEKLDFNNEEVKKLKEEAKEAIRQRGEESLRSSGYDPKKFDDDEIFLRGYPRTEDAKNELLSSLPTFKKKSEERLNTMPKKDLADRINFLKERQSRLELIDHWDRETQDYWNKLSREELRVTDVYRKRFGNSRNGEELNGGSKLKNNETMGKRDEARWSSANKAALQKAVDESFNKNSRNEKERKLHLDVERNRFIEQRLASSGYPSIEAFDKGTIEKYRNSWRKSVESGLAKSLGVKSLPKSVSNNLWKRLGGTEYDLSDSEILDTADSLWLHYRG